MNNEKGTINPLKKLDAKKAVSLAGSVLMIVALVFVAMRLIDMREELDLSILTNTGVLTLLLLIVIFEGIIVICSSLNYRKIVIEVSGVNVLKRVGVKVYNNANIYKYIPGGVMLVLGRNQIAVETEGMSHAKVAISTLVEGILWAISALILSAIFSFEFLVIYIRQLEFEYIWLVLGGIILAASFVLYILYRFRHKILKSAFNIDSKSDEKPANIKITKLLKRIPIMIAIVSLWGFSFTATMAILGQPMTLYLVVTLTGLYILSWLIGFLTPGAPSGLGIREVLLLMFLGGLVNEDLLLSAVVIHRAIQVISDILAFAIARTYAAIGSSSHKVSN
ncbi:MAG: hypothetical protein FWC13_02235 [Oscillospiraceae bacterium]|nr:hypothetical protein [Oscillospiraceae bacterium]